VTGRSWRSEVEGTRPVELARSPGAFISHYTGHVRTAALGCLVEQARRGVPERKLATRNWKLLLAGPRLTLASCSPWPAGENLIPPSPVQHLSKHPRAKQTQSVSTIQDSSGESALHLSLQLIVRPSLFNSAVSRSEVSPETRASSSLRSPAAWATS